MKNKKDNFYRSIKKINQEIRLTVWEFVHFDQQRQALP